MITDPEILQCRRRYATGRRISAARTTPRTLGDMMRKHMHEEGILRRHLAVAWDCTRETVTTRLSMARKRPLASQHVDAFIELLKLDEFDATELHRMAAREAGFKIDGPQL